MVAMSDIKEYGQRIGRQFGAERVVLFGSYAQGTQSEDSDIDLMVIANTSLSPSERYCAVRRLLADVPCSFDIIVKTPEEFARWRTVVNNIIYFADKYGKVIYERAES
jgi:predicted nucleotidyltransferase